MYSVYDFADENSLLLAATERWFASGSQGMLHHNSHNALKPISRVFPKNHPPCVLAAVSSDRQLDEQQLIVYWLTNDQQSEACDSIATWQRE